MTDEEIISEISNFTGLSKRYLEARTYMELSGLAKDKPSLRRVILEKAKSQAEEKADTSP